MTSPPVVSPNGRLVAGVVSDQVHLWETMTGRIRATWPCPKDAAAPAFAFSPEGRYLAAGGDRQFWLRDLLTGKETGPWPGHRGAVRTFAFSADGRRLATGGADTTALVWDLARLTPARPEPVTRADSKEVEGWWTDLIDGDGKKVQGAIAALVAAPGPALGLLKERLRPMNTDRSPERVRRLIDELDDAKFAVRERATQELENLGEDVAPQLRAALDKKPSLEVSRRLDDLLKRLKGEAPAPGLRVQRALEALEHMNTPEAGQLLETLAKGSADAWLTRDAQATLRRMASRNPKQ